MKFIFTHDPIEYAERHLLVAEESRFSCPAPIFGDELNEKLQAAEKNGAYGFFISDIREDYDSYADRSFLIASLFFFYQKN